MARGIVVTSDILLHKWSSCQATVLDKINEKSGPTLLPFQWCQNGALLAPSRLHHCFGGDGGFPFYFILSKIVACKQARLVGWGIAGKVGGAATESWPASPHSSHRLRRLSVAFNRDTLTKQVPEPARRLTSSRFGLRVKRVTKGSPS